MGGYVGVVASPFVEIEVDDRVLKVTNPDRVYFPASGATKLDLARYYLAVGPGIVNALRERPCMLHRFPTGLSGEKVHQKRVPAGAPPWLETVRVHFPRYGLHADELCVVELADVIWAVQMSTVDICTAQITAPSSVTHSSSAVRFHRGKCSRTVSIHGGAPAGTRFWCTLSPESPFGKRCSMVGRSKSALTMPGPTAR